MGRIVRKLNKGLLSESRINQDNIVSNIYGSMDGGGKRANNGFFVADAWLE